MSIHCRKERCLRHPVKRWLRRVKCWRSLYLSITHSGKKTANSQKALIKTDRKALKTSNNLAYMYTMSLAQRQKCCLNKALPVSSLQVRHLFFSYKVRNIVDFNIKIAGKVFSIRTLFYFVIEHSCILFLSTSAIRIPWPRNNHAQGRAALRGLGTPRYS